MKYLRKSLIITVLACALVLLMALGAAAADVNEIASLTLNKAKTDLAFEISLTPDYVKEHKNMQLGLFELLPHQSASDVGSMTPVKTFKVAEKGDWWFHVHGAPGSHVILICNGVDDPPAEDFTQAAVIAACS